MADPDAMHGAFERSTPAPLQTSSTTDQLQRMAPSPVGTGLEWAALFFVLGSAPRLYNLTYHSLWLDEAISIGWAQMPVRTILSVSLNLVQDRHPPLYYLLLHVWTRLFGDGEFSVRMLSALAGAMIVPLGYLLGRELYGHRAGVATAALLAVNPFLVWYSQEVRMFTLATTLLLAASLALVGALQRRGAWRWVAYVILGTAAFYTYLLSALVLVAHGIYVSISWLRWRVLRHQTASILVSFGALVLICAPLSWQAWQISAAEGSNIWPFANLSMQFEQVLRALVFWKVPWSAPLLTVVTILIGLLALWGAVVPLSDNNLMGRTSFVTTFLFVPWLVGNLLLFADRTIFDQARYVIFLAPALCLALARPVGAALPGIRGTGWAISALAFVVFLTALPFNWTAETRREEWRATARYLATHSGPDDIILLHADYTFRPFLYYYQGEAEVIYPFTGAIESDDQLEPVLSHVVKHPTVWLVRSHWEIHDPKGLLDRWFAQRYPLITELYPPGIIIKGYATSYQVDAPPPDTVLLDAVFDDKLKLAACQISPTQTEAQDDLFHPPSGWVHATLYWQAADTLTTAYKPTVKLIDGLGQVWGNRLERSHNTMEMVPPPQWPVGKYIRDDYDINLNPATPPGIYRIEVGLQNLNGTLLPVTYGGVESEHVICGLVEVVE